MKALSKDEHEKRALMAIATMSGAITAKLVPDAPWWMFVVVSLPIAMYHVWKFDRGVCE